MSENQYSNLTEQEALTLVEEQFEIASVALRLAAKIAKSAKLDYVSWDAAPHGGMAGYLEHGRWQPDNQNWDSSSANC